MTQPGTPFIPGLKELKELVVAGPKQWEKDMLVWDTRITEKGSLEFLLYQLEGWEIASCDTLPSQGPQGQTYMKQVVHFKKLVPCAEIRKRAAEVVAAAESHIAQATLSVPGLGQGLLGPDGNPVS